MGAIVSYVCDDCGHTFAEPTRHENKEYLDYGGRGAWVTESYDEVCPECGSDRIRPDPLRDLVRLADEVGALIIEDDCVVGGRNDEVEIVFHGAELRAFARAIKEGKA